MSPTPAQVLAAVKKSGVTYQLMPGWDSPAIAAPGVWAPDYVILHHTANGGASGNNPSLGWVIHDNYAPIRACHFLVGRDGRVFVIYALACYHAGAGGPGKWGNGQEVPKDTMNHYAYGIEIESKGTSLTVDSTNGITVAQKAATAALTRELLALMGATVECAINHRTWAPGRKSDTLMSDADWHALIGGGDMTLTPAEIAAIAEAVWEHAIKSSWNGENKSAAALLNQSSFYSMESGYVGATPKTALTSPGTPTVAKQILDAATLDTPASSGGTAGPTAAEIADEVARRMAQ